jgi:hypothetical protein
MRVPVYLKQEQVRCGTITEHELAAQSGTFAVSAFRVRGALHRARASEQQATHHGPRFDSIPLQSGALGITAACHAFLSRDRGYRERTSAPLRGRESLFFSLSARGATRVP